MVDAVLTVPTGELGIPDLTHVKEMALPGVLEVKGPARALAIQGAKWSSFVAFGQMVPVLRYPTETGYMTGRLTFVVEIDAFALCLALAMNEGWVIASGEAQLLKQLKTATLTGPMLYEAADRVAQARGPRTLQTRGRLTVRLIKGGQAEGGTSE